MADVNSFWAAYNQRVASAKYHLFPHERFILRRYDPSLPPRRGSENSARTALRERYGNEGLGLFGVAAADGAIGALFVLVGIGLLIADIPQTGFALQAVGLFFILMLLRRAQQCSRFDSKKSEHR